MHCLQCGHDDTKVLDSRLSQDGRAVRRRRSCIQCNYRFTTYEKEEEFIFQVKKRDGRIEPYFREKLARSINVACQKRPLSKDDIDQLITKLERHLAEENERVVSSQKLGDLVMEALYSLDKIAYVRFASVYRDFKSPQEFAQALKELE